MKTTVDRKQTSFRLRADLLNRLRMEARKENRSLNNYVENILMNVISQKPNKITLEAMHEAESGKDLETIELDDFKEYVSSL
ncbi:toxin-antitoxin system protein [Limibacterium fermenti]|uniref:toxin-antitoxin system protein n=1 Tax=Limibacterium fermenti TaxID=3229863 RepID=UPI000E96A462|nr:toxin-antitoxin system protein [Porphyromonadaceae bacterium]HBX45488.1 toxin-antitoxin system protein [Porphyromonadaceae bacterium]